MDVFVISCKLDDYDDTESYTNFKVEENGFNSLEKAQDYLESNNCKKVNDYEYYHILGYEYEIVKVNIK